MTSEEQAFLSAGQEKIKLNIALSSFFDTEDMEWKERLREYLKKRFRPAMSELIRRQDAAHINALLKEGWLTPGILDSFIREAAESGSSEVCVLLLKYKKESSGLHNQKIPNPPGVPAPVSYMSEDNARGTFCAEIWTISRERLMVRYPLFRPLLMNFVFRESTETDSAGTDGTVVYYSPDFLLRHFRQDTESAERLLLHLLYHCLFLHPVLDAPKNRPLWDLACDIAVQRILKKNSGAKSAEPVSSPELLYEKLTLLKKQMAGQTGPAADPRKSFDRISLVENGFRTFPELKIPVGRLCPDDHRFWQKADKNSLLDQAGAVWGGAGEEFGFGLYGSDGIGQAPGNKTAELVLEQKRSLEFRRYLKRFAVHREELTPDLSGFDYIPYLFGLWHYGNIPLIEHLEYQEINRLEELVIAVDTSGSCSVDTVRRFMEETYAILSDHENFFKKMNVYVIQCDCFVRDAAHITCEKDWTEYLKKLTIHGRGGTDFRPVFRYVAELLRTRKLKHLRGLLYFTDGDGIYPEKPTEYETAFVFYKEKEHHQRVPAWAKCLRLPENLYTKHPEEIL